MILHLMKPDKFLAPFIDFIDENFGRGAHKYILITSEKYTYDLKPEHNVEFLHTDEDIFVTLLQYMQDARKIILHGLWRDKVSLLLYNNEKLLDKCYWAMWGGDFYFPEKQDEIKKHVIKKVGYLLTQVEGDVELVRHWYGAEGTHIKLMCGYPSNVYKELNIPHSLKDKTTNILVGNSATQTNQHLKVFERLLKFKNKDINIYVPLSYGDKIYAEEIKKIGRELFGNKFTPITEFMPMNKYIEFLSSMDTVIFFHSRQQGVGNLINLLGLGKKVYLNNKTTTYRFFQDKNVLVFDFLNFDLKPLSLNQKNINKALIKKLFSKSTLLDDCEKYLI